MKRLKVLLAALLICMFSCLITVNAQAASYQKITQEKEKIGQYYVWLDNGMLTVSNASTGETVKLASGYPSAISNGNYVYLGKLQSDSMKLYRYKLSTGEVVLLDEIKHGEAVVGYYQSKLYVERHDSSGSYGCDYTYIHTYSYNLKTGKMKRVMKNISVGDFYGKYLIGMPNSGAYMELPLKVYNAKTGKTKTLSSKALGFSRIGKYVYYVHATKVVSGGWQARAYRYTLTTGTKKALGKTFTTSGVREIKKKYVRYYTISGALRKATY